MRRLDASQRESCLALSEAFEEEISRYPIFVELDIQAIVIPIDDGALMRFSRCRDGGNDIAEELFQYDTLDKCTGTELSKIVEHFTEEMLHDLLVRVGA